MSRFGGKGTILTGEQCAKYARKNGLCPNCFQRTHEIKGNFWSKTMVPLEEVTDRSGNVIVYKGHCIQPTCSSLNEVKQLLGELNTRRGHPKRLHRNIGTLGEPDVDEGNSNQEITFSPDPRDSGVTPPEDVRASSEYPAGNCDGSTSSSSKQSLTMPGDRRPESARSHQRQRSDKRYTESQVELNLRSIQDPIVSKMQEAAAIGDFTLFLTLLEAQSKQANKTAIVEAFAILCKCIPMQLDKGNLYAFANDFWVKSLTVVIEDNSDDNDIQYMSASTLTVLSAVSDAYRNDIVLHGGAKVAIAILDKKKGNAGFVDVCCCAIFCMIDREYRGVGPKPFKTGLLVSHAIGSQVVEVLIAAVDSASNFAKRWIFSSLLNLSLQNLRTQDEKSFGTLVSEAVENQGIDILIKAVTHDAKDAVMILLGLDLLSRLSENHDDDMCMPPLSDSLVNAILSLINNIENCLDRVSGFLVLGNLPWGSDFLSANTMMSLAETVSTSMTAFNENEALQIAAMKTVSNLLRPSPERNQILQWDTLVSAITAAMNEYKQNLEVQCYGCQALATILSCNDPCKRAILETNGVFTVASAIMHPSAVDGNNPDVVDAMLLFGCTALMSLAATLQSLQDESLDMAMHALKDVIHLNGDRLPETTRAHVKAVLSGGIHSNQDDDKDVINFEIHALLKASSCEDAEQRLVSVCSRCERSTYALNCLILANEGSGISFLTGLMSKYRGSLVVQEAVCDILFLVYCTFPFQGCLSLAQRVIFDSSEFNIVTHSAEQIINIREAIKVHRTKPTLVTKAFKSLTGFFRNTKNGEFEPNPELVHRFCGMFKDCVDALSVHQEHLDVLNSTMDLVQCLLLLKDEMELRRWCSYLLDAILTNLQHHRAIDETVINGSYTLRAIVAEESENGAISLINKELFFAVFWRCLSSNEEEMVDIVLGLIATIAARVISLLEFFLESQDFPLVLVNCMFRFGGSPTIVESACSVIQSCSTMYDDHLMWTFVQSRAVEAILEVVHNHQNNESIQESAWRACVTLLQVANSSLIQEMKSDVAEAILRSLDDNMTSAETEAHILEVFSFVCCVDAWFKEVLTKNSAIPKIIEVMDLHLQEVGVQSGGCSCLYILSAYGQNHVLIGKSGGISTILNALLAHINVPRLQKEALETLKNLATWPHNKEILRAYGAEEAIVISMRGNLSSEEIFSVSLTALNNVAVCVKTQVVTMAPLGAFDCIVIGMRVHKSSLSVQANAVFLLKSYTFSESIYEMRSMKDEFIEALTRAADTFPDECSQRAYQIIQKLL